MSAQSGTETNLIRELKQFARKSRTKKFSRKEWSDGREANSLEDADLSGLDLSHSGFSGTSFVNSNLAGVDFSGASVINANFKNCDLRGIQVREKVDTATREGAWPAKVKDALFEEGVVIDQKGRTCVMLDGAQIRVATLDHLFRIR